MQNAALVAADRSAQPTRREIALWLVVATLANQALHAVDLRSASQFLASVLSQNLVYWFACFALLTILYHDAREERSRPLDLIAAICGGVALLLTALIGYRFGVGLVATGVAAHLLLNWGGDRSLRAAGAIMLALCAHLIWGPILFQYFLPWILQADAWAVSLFLELFHPETILDGSSIYGADGHSVALVGGCSSFQNISIAILAYVAAVMLVRQRWVRGDFFWLSAVCATLILMNTIRLGVLGMDAGSYAYWHDGMGVQVLAIGQTLVIGVLSAVGAVRGKTGR